MRMNDMPPAELVKLAYERAKSPWVRPADSDLIRALAVALDVQYARANTLAKEATDNG